MFVSVSRFRSSKYVHTYIYPPIVDILPESIFLSVSLSLHCGRGVGDGDAGQEGEVCQPVRPPLSPSSPLFLAWPWWLSFVALSSALRLYSFWSAFIVIHFMSLYLGPVFMINSSFARRLILKIWLSFNSQELWDCHPFPFLFCSFSVEISPAPLS